MGSSVRVNGKIRAPQVRVVDDRLADLGVMSLARALELARSRGVDLIEIGPDAEPPLCRLVDYAKYRYELRRDGGA
jgi:translation initiation factor IF-3